MYVLLLVFPGIRGCSFQFSTMTRRALVSVAGFSPPRPGFGTRVGHVRFVIDKVALRQVPRVLQFAPVIIPTVLHVH